MSTESVSPSRPKNGLLASARKIMPGFAALIAALVIVVAVQPANYTVTRSIVINAPPDRAFAQVNDFHHWNGWSPWARLDPNVQTTYDGPPAGNDAVYTWKGNDKVGEGRMTITDSHPSDTIKVKLEFERPMKSTADAVFTFKPQKEQDSETLVIWSISGRKNFRGKAFGLVVSMDNRLGAEFEKGLHQLKTVAEAQSAATPK
jgi:hypothetical protein